MGVVPVSRGTGLAAMLFAPRCTSIAGKARSYEVRGMSDIAAYLKQHEEKPLLRFITCGSVDDGKSTLIGRLLYDSKRLFDDQLAALSADSRRHGTRGGEIDYALLLDGLAAEREQGITIDVAYRYFDTERRQFIVADCPGHEQYTRTWPRAPPPPTLRWCWWMQGRAC